MDHQFLKCHDQTRAGTVTSDNLLLSRVKNEAEIFADVFAVNCKQRAPASVEGYISESLAERTRTAYLSDLSHFESWGGYRLLQKPLPHILQRTPAISLWLPLLGAWRLSQRFIDPGGLKIQRLQSW